MLEYEQRKKSSHAREILVETFFFQKENSMSTNQITAQKEIMIPKLI